jgi:alpha-tubulin suppressor-like RCC1 family protein
MILAGCSDDVLDPSEPVVASLDIVDAPAALLVADTVRLTLVAMDSSGTAITPTVTWTVSNGAVASVSSSGLVSGRAEGTTAIRVAAGALSDSISLTVTEGVRFATLVTGISHTCGLTSAGAVYCWGSNSSMNLGVETTTHSCTVPPSTKSYSCSPRPVRVGGSIQFSAVSAGTSHNCGLTADGRAYCWGDNSWEQLGTRGDLLFRSATPVPVSGGQVFRTLNAGGDFTCGLTTGNAAYCWGSHGWGELGTGDLELFTSYMPVAVVGGHDFAQLASGDLNACGLTGSGQAYCWGVNDIGQVGNGSVAPPGAWPAEPTPSLVAGGLTFSWLGAGGAFTCGLTTAGAAFCWGGGSLGRLGTGSTANYSSPQPVAGGLIWRSLSVGIAHVCGFTTAGAAACWGRNVEGQLGVAPTGEHCPSSRATDPPLDCSTRPVLLPASTRRFKTIVPAGGYTCALDDLGYAFCWGGNEVAQLGNGQVGGRSHVPSPVIRPE